MTSSAENGYQFREEKMASRPGRIPKRNLNESDAPSILKFLKRNDECSAETTARQIVAEIIQSVVDKCEKSAKKHAGDSVSDKTAHGWKVQYPWLIITGKGKDKRLKCKLCENMKMRSVWAEDGSTNFQFNSVRRHSESKEHQKAELETAKLACSSQVSDSETEGDIVISVSSSDMYLFRTVFCAAYSEFPSSQINTMLQLQKMNGVNIDYQNLSWDTITEIQSCISKIFKKELVNDIKKSDFFAVMIDESTDLTIQKHLSVCVRLVKGGEPVTKYLANVNLEDGKAHTVVNELVRCLNDNGLDTSKIVSLATDGAATMTGKKTGVGVQMRSKYAPFVVQTHCIAHRLNLAVTDSIKKEDALIKFKEKFSALYHFISGSSNRTTKLKKIQDLLQEPNLTIKEPHSIRWLGLKNAVEAVFESYNSLLATLEYFAAENSSVAKGLVKYFKQYKVVMLVSFMLDVHNVLGFLSKEFQRENITFSEFNPLIEAVLGKLDFIEAKDGDALRSMRQLVEFRTEDSKQTAYLEGEKLMGYSAKSESELLSLRSKYIACLKKNLKHRFRQEDCDMLKNLSVLLEPGIVNAASDSEHEEALREICKHFAEDKIVRVVQGDLAHEEDLREEKKSVKKLLDKDKLLQEWPMVKGMIQGSYKNKTTPSLCKRIILMHGSAFPEFSNLCKIALCMSVSSVSCERSFSTQNRLKNKYRSSLKAENLDVLIQIQMSGTDLSSYDPSKAVILWTTRKRRRKARLTQQYKPRQKSTSALASCK